jgi:putative alpha-1,2-mannosidase
MLEETFSTKPSGIPGNDDLGAMSGLYVWGALGLYPAIPGVPGLAVGTPMFDLATIHFENGGKLEISRSGRGIYVQSLAIDGKTWNSSWIPLERLGRKTSRLHFEMKETPNFHWATEPGAVPPSFSEQGINR